MVAKNNPIQTEQFDTLKLIGIVASKPSWNSLESFIGITAVNKEMNFGIIRHLTDAVRRNRPKKNGAPTFGYSFTTMLQHTGGFWSRIS